MRLTLFLTLVAVALVACSPAAETPIESAADDSVALASERETVAPTATESAPSATPAAVDDVPLDDASIDATATAIAEINNVETDADGFIRTPVIELSGLAPGEARAIALATDEAYKPEVEADVALEGDAPYTLTFADFYSGFDLRRGLLFTDYLASLDGQQVILEGYVAPPLKPRLDWFVLSRIQLAFCPFCSTDVEWPSDIALVYLDEEQIVTYPYPVRITGQLEVGSNIDAETGMVSLVRVYAESIERAETYNVR